MLHGKPKQHQIRQDWEKQIREAIKLLDNEKDDDDWLDAQLTNDNEWEWQEEL